MNRGMSELKNIEIRLISRLERKSEEDISNIMDEVYNECCMIEKVDYSEAYGFGSEGIKEYILTMLLLDIIEEGDEKYLIGSIRLLIKGIWGCLDYSKVMRYVSREKLGISSEVWHRVLDLVEERFPNLLENELAIKKVKEPIYTDVGMIEKISILENFQEDESFEDRIDKILEENEDEDLTEKKNRITENKPTEIDEEYMGYDDEQISLVNYHINNKETNKKGKLAIVIGILIALLLMFLWINGLSSKSKEEEKQVKHTINTNNNSNDNKSGEDNASTTDENKNDSSEENQSNESDNSIDKSLKSYDKVNYDTATKYYCLYSQAFVYENGAKEVSENIKAQNIYTKVVNEDNCYKVRIGSAYNLEETKKIREELKKKSIHTYILAYDMEVEDKIKEIKSLADLGDLEGYKDKYIKLRNEIKGKSYYGRYVDQIDYIYRNRE